MSEPLSGRRGSASALNTVNDPGGIDNVPPGMSAYLFVDTFAVEKLSAQPECLVGSRNATIHGYETYVIEQWACERQINTVVASFTGNSQDVVEVQVLYVPSSLEKWSPATFAHFEELVRMHILPKETPLGNMLVTSLSSLPSNLSLVPMPPRFTEGRLWFIVNKNLRRLNVVGRVATTADVPSDSVMANFRRSYNTSSVVPAGYAVKELVTLMQISLVYFGLLNPEYVDGFICDYTMRALGTWWTSFGKQRYRTTPPRPTDKLYMRTSCAGLVGAVTGARQRLSALGLKPPKDPFDAENFVECVKRFQKIEKLARTKFLDEKTYFKLIHETAKLNSLGGTNVLTVMKSTVKEGFSGKATGGVDDWETLDLDVLAANARGRRSQYLWQGKGSQSVPHVNPHFPIDTVGANSGIPQFSLTQEGLDDGSRHISSHAHHPHRPRRHHHHTHHLSIVAHDTELPVDEKHDLRDRHHNGSVDSTGSLLSIASRDKIAKSPEKSVKSPEKGARSLEEFPGLLESSTDTHNSFVSQFMKKQQHQQHQQEQQPASEFGLGEPFDDSKKHMRALSTSSEHWFASRGQSPPKQSAVSLPRIVSEAASEKTQEAQAVDRKEFDTPDSAAKLFTRDDLFLNGRTKSPVLRRTASLGEIENIVFPWDSPCALPKVVLLYHEARDLKNQLTMRLNDEEQTDSLLQKDISANDGLISAAQRNNVLIKYQVNATTKKEDIVRRRVRELEAFMARLDYELGTMRVKLKDVEQSVMAFTAKVDAIDTRWVQSKELGEKPWYTRWLWFW